MSPPSEKINLGVIAVVVLVVFAGCDWVIDAALKPSRGRRAGRSTTGIR